MQNQSSIILTSNSIYATTTYANNVNCSGAPFLVTFSSLDASGFSCGSWKPPSPTGTKPICTAVTSAVSAPTPSPSPYYWTHECPQQFAVSTDTKKMRDYSAVAFNNQNAILLEQWNDATCNTSFKFATSQLPGVCVANVPGNQVIFYLDVDNSNTGSMYACGDSMCGSCSPITSVTADQNNTCQWNFLVNTYVRVTFPSYQQIYGGSSTATSLGTSSTSTPTLTGKSGSGNSAKRLSLTGANAITAILLISSFILTVSFSS